MKLYIDGIGFRGPGLPNWADSTDILAGRAPYMPAPVTLVSSELLPVAERRRTTDTVKLALAIGSEAMQHAAASPQTTRSVFSSSGGDGVTIDAILQTLATDNREVSPTRFHNSVHNAPAGYWSIATQSREASTSLCAHDFSFAAGLLEAAVQTVAEDQPVLFVSYDMPYPGLLATARPMTGICGIALLLSPRRTTQSLAAISIDLTRSAGETRLQNPDFETLRTQNPAARGLPLLVVLAQSGFGQIAIPTVAGNFLRVDIAPPQDAEA